MRVGSARYCISPKEKTFYLLGYKTPIRNHPAEGIHDDIYCNSLLFDNGNQRVFILSADLLELEDDFVEEVKTKLNEIYQIPRDHIVICVTHNHSSIRDFHKNWEFGEFNQRYYENLIETIVQSFGTCQANLTEATAKYGRQIIEGFYSNRNHPGQLADNEVIVLKFYDKDEKPFASIVNWAVHSTVLGADNKLLTGDLAGQTCEKLGEKWGFYPVMVVGAAADCSNRFNRQGKDFAELERASNGLATAINEIPINDPIEFGDISYQTLSHAIHPDISKYHTHLRETIENIRNGSIKPKGFPPEALIHKCEEQLKVNHYNLVLQFEVLVIGNLQFYIFPGELGSKFGIQLKAATNKLSIVIGYANGFHYYFLPEEEYGLSFETIGNPVPPGEPEKIVAKFIQSAKLLSL